MELQPKLLENYIFSLRMMVPFSVTSAPMQSLSHGNFQFKVLRACHSIRVGGHMTPDRSNRDALQRQTLPLLRPSAHDLSLLLEAFQLVYEHDAVRVGLGGPVARIGVLLLHGGHEENKLKSHH